MTMVGVVSGSLYRRTHKSSGLVLGRRALGAILHSSNEPDELSQWLCHDDSTINIVVIFIIIIIINTRHSTSNRDMLKIAILHAFDVPFRGVEVLV